MKASNLRRRPIRRESGSFWLSFSDMMSVLVLVFIFVIFSMMLSLDRQKEQLEKTEDQYAEAMARMEKSEKALSEKEGLLADSEAQLKIITEELEGKTVILAQREKELTEKEGLLADSEAQLQVITEELEGKTVILDQREKELTEKEGLLADSEAQIQVMTKELEGKTVILAQRETELTEKEGLLANSEAQLQVITEELEGKTVILAQREKELTEKEGLLADSEAQIQVMTKELEGKTVILAQHETELTEKEDELRILKQELDDKTLILIQRESELSDQADQISREKEDMESQLIVLSGEKDALTEQLKQANEALSRLAVSERELEDSRLTVIDLTRQLSEAKDSLTHLQGEYETQRQQIVILGEKNSALLTDAGKAREALSEAEAENARLSQRISMLNGNAESKQSEIDRLLKLIDEKQKELDALGIDYESLLSFSKETQTALETAETVLRTQSEQLTEQFGQIAEYEASLDGYRAELARTQGQLEQMVGVKAQIVQSLSNALRANHVDVTVDVQTGAIRLPSEMLFAQDSNALSAEGKRYLDRFLPVYMNVLMSADFRPYIAEIIIEGHTDSRGSYIYNLGLSQTRALSVAEYVLDDHYVKGTLGLENDEGNTLRALITASGRSFSAPILNASGAEDQDASRRVEIKFRLKDDDTVALTESLLKLIGNE